MRDNHAGLRGSGLRAQQDSSVGVGTLARASPSGWVGWARGVREGLLDLQGLGPLAEEPVFSSVGGGGKEGSASWEWPGQIPGAAPWEAGGGGRGSGAGRRQRPGTRCSPLTLGS